MVRTRNWLAPREPSWVTSFTPSKPVRDPTQDAHTALHQYHLFPTCLVADDKIVVAGSGCYESVGDPTTLMIGSRLLQFFDVSTGENILSVPAHATAILDVQLDEKYVYSCSIDRSIALWDRNTGSRVTTLYGHLKAVYQIQLYENLIISAGKDRTIRFWDPSIRDENAAYVLPHNQQNAPPVSLTIGTGLDKLPLKPTPETNLRAGSRGLQSVILAHAHSVRRFAVTDGEIFSVSGRGHGCLWDMETRSLVNSFEVLDDALSLAALHNDVVITSSDGLQHFDTRMSCLKPVRECKEGNSNGGISPSSSSSSSPTSSLHCGGRQVSLDSVKMLFADSKGYLRIWDWNMFREVNHLRVAKHRCCYYYDVNEERLFTGGNDKFMKRFDFSTRPSSLLPPTPEKKCSVM